MNALVTVVGLTAILYSVNAQNEVTDILLPNFFNQLDADSDGFMSESEMQSAFTAADLNGDGMVTEKEFFLAMRQSFPTLWHCAKIFFTAFDINHQHSISDTHVTGIYALFDSNNNDYVSSQEFITYMSGLVSNCPASGH